jgi:KDO2-lipid IV(A) lauroyltransferase
MGGERTTQGFGRKSTRRWQRVVLSVLTLLSTCLQRVTRPKAMRFAARLGAFAYLVNRRYVKRSHQYALRNLRLTQFPRPDATLKEREAFIQRVFIHFCKGLVDFLCGPSLTSEELHRVVHAEGMEFAEAARRAGKGTIFITAHLGNWEMLGRYLASEGIPLTVVAREPEDPAFAAWVHRMREGAGMSVAYRGGSARELLSLLKANKAVGLLPDQNSSDVFTPFFGVPAGTATGPAAIALHTGATLIPSYCVRLPDDTYRLMLLPPIPSHSTGDRQTDILRITTEVNRVLESVIREYPDQWLWLHNRWKSAFEEGNRERSWPDGPNPDVWRRWQGEVAS